MKMEYDHSQIPGWGMDADPNNEPTYPMKVYTGDDHNRIGYSRSAQQEPDVEVLVSNERPEITRVFGNTLPPKGLSGWIRRYAFRHSEDRYRHWLPLLLADRINVIEGLAEDLSKGFFPNTLSERGLKMEMKFAPRKLALKSLCWLAAGLAIYAVAKRRRRH